MLPGAVYSRLYLTDLFWELLIFLNAYFNEVCKEVSGGLTKCSLVSV